MLIESCWIEIIWYSLMFIMVTMTMGPKRGLKSGCVVIKNQRVGSKLQGVPPQHQSLSTVYRAISTIQDFFLSWSHVQFRCELCNLGNTNSTVPMLTRHFTFLTWIKNIKMSEALTKFWKVINFEGIKFSNLYYTVVRKYNEQSNETVLVF